ncbi:hypothetical protein [Lentzea jiangxiensis]|uniref:Uncharacterized protein n=1 Tax=Lentzea jiangxiensis TaxID=641025 RepID=A0A1H0X8V5_9PSEU|nr:hypothetical protein [Lentzea jiangxiensis]SDP99185.1 hypothetical protein SAMN05421507_1534 [Lentzea jiangxiensis]
MFKKISSAAFAAAVAVGALMFAASPTSAASDSGKGCRYHKLSDELGGVRVCRTWESLNDGTGRYRGVWWTEKRQNLKKPEETVLQGNGDGRVSTLNIMHGAYQDNKVFVMRVCVRDLCTAWT